LTFWEYTNVVFKNYLPYYQCVMYILIFIFIKRLEVEYLKSYLCTTPQGREGYTLRVFPLKKQGLRIRGHNFLKKRFADSGKIPTFAVPWETGGYGKGCQKEAAEIIFRKPLEIRKRFLPLQSLRKRRPNTEKSDGRNALRYSPKREWRHTSSLKKLIM
jgi:hypothetical protein